MDKLHSVFSPSMFDLKFLFDSSGVFRNESNYKDGTLTKIVNGFAKKIILDVGLGYDCASR